jgi:NADPH:quinone reductase-like Zn-dependent oxidoreductase
MRVWQVSSFGIDSVESVERTDLQPGPGEVLVRIRAVSLNYRDLMVVSGRYNPKMQLPRIPCSDGAGEIMAVGPGVTNWRLGDRVAGIFMQNWFDGQPTREKLKGALGGDIDGMLAEHVVLAASGLVAIPSHMSFEDAATLPCAAVTAWNALTAAKLRPGSTVLIQGTGGVSIFALQFARMMGARVLGISGSDEKLDRAHALGLDAGTNYHKTPQWDGWVVEQSGGEGVDLVVEVGGVGTLPLSLRAARIGGTIAQIGLLAGRAEDLPLPLIFHKLLHVRGIYVGSRRDFEDMNKAIVLAAMRPVYESFPWSRIKEVLHRMEEGKHFGKLVLTIDS